MIDFIYNEAKDFLGFSWNPGQGGINEQRQFPRALLVVSTSNHCLVEIVEGMTAKIGKCCSQFEDCMRGQPRQADLHPRRQRREFRPGRVICYAFCPWSTK